MSPPNSIYTHQHIVSILTCSHLISREKLSGGIRREQSQPPHYWLLVNYIKVASQSHSLESWWLTPVLHLLMEKMLGFFIWLTLYLGPTAATFSIIFSFLSTEL